jgi:hypothetical protein
VKLHELDALVDKMLEADVLEMADGVVPIDDIAHALDQLGLSAADQDSFIRAMLSP